MGETKEKQQQKNELLINKIVSLFMRRRKRQRRFSPSPLFSLTLSSLSTRSFGCEVNVLVVVVFCDFLLVVWRSHSQAITHHTPRIWNMKEKQKSKDYLSREQVLTEDLTEVRPDSLILDCWCFSLRVSACACTCVCHVWWAFYLLARLLTSKFTQLF